MKRYTHPVDYNSIQQLHPRQHCRKRQVQKTPITEDEKIVFNDKACVIYFPTFLTEQEADVLFQQLYDSVPWGQELVKVYGKTFLAKRKTAAYADQSNRDYKYAGKVQKASKWTPEIEKLKKNIEIHLRARGIERQFNFALLNLYADGKDSIGWHSDDEKDLVDDGVIASISLGAERAFQLRAKQGDNKKIITTSLKNGSLLCMYGNTQKNYKHCVPVRMKVKNARINITFREIHN